MARPFKTASRLSKDAILTASLELLDEGGGGAVTFRALAKKLDVTPMAISHHVGSRREMFASLVAKVYADVGREAEGTDPKDRIRVMLEQYCERVIAHPNLVQCIFADPSLFSGQLVVLTRKIGENLALGGATPSELETLVNVIVDYTHGFAISAAATSGVDEEHEDMTRRQTLEDYLRGLGWLLGNIS